MCPVCETPIKNTKVNPYENARVKLKNLEIIAGIQKQKEESFDHLLTKTSELVKDIEIKTNASLEIGIKFLIKIPVEFLTLNYNKSESKNYLEKLKLFLIDINSNVESFRILDLELIKNNEKLNNLSENKIKLNQEKDLLQKIRTKITEIKASESVISNSIAKSNLTIKEFNEKNKKLIDEVEKEKVIIEENKKYIDAYNILIKKLNDYKDDLPINLVKNLNDLTKEFYNIINVNDKSFELIEKIELPLIPGQKIKVCFQDEPDKEIDPIHILSEGHIRCLGLSILLAKAINENLNFIIFDDVVNAIDNDHRSGIRELLFSNDKLKGKQIIITSHSEEYIKEIENTNLTERDYEDFVKCISFTKDNKKITPKLDSAMGYVLRAKEHFSKNQKTDTLSNCRKALENLINLLWKRFCRKNNTPLNVRMYGPEDSPELSCLCDSLLVELSKKPEEYSSIIESIKWFKGLELKNNIIWKYLNQSAHSAKLEMEDFDPVIVKEVLDNVVKFDGLLKSKK